MSSPEPGAACFRGCSAIIWEDRTFAIATWCFVLQARHHSHSSLGDRHRRLLRHRLQLGQVSIECSLGARRKSRGRQITYGDFSEALIGVAPIPKSEASYPIAHPRPTVVAPRAPEAAGSKETCMQALPYRAPRTFGSKACLIPCWSPMTIPAASDRAGHAGSHKCRLKNGARRT